MSNDDNYKNELISNSDKIVENGVFKGDIMKVDSDEVEIVSESERVMGCKGVETKVYQLEREYEESVRVERWQRVKFFNGVEGGEERSSRRYWVDKWSTNNCFLNFCIVPVEIRRGFNVVVPSVWDGRENGIWRCGERYLESCL